MRQLGEDSLDVEDDLRALSSLDAAIEFLHQQHVFAVA